MHETEPHDAHGGHGPAHSAEEHSHPGARRYLEIAFILAIITAIEVAIFYTPAVRPLLVPILLILSALKFALVVLFYMHLKFDHRLFSGFFVAPLTLAAAVMISLLFLFQALGRHGSPPSP
jgi:cytochrome c oxidase subunit 4